MKAALSISATSVALLAKATITKDPETGLLRENTSHTRTKIPHPKTTAYADDSDAYRDINFQEGASSNTAECYDRYVRCVRTYTEPL